MNLVERWFREITTKRIRRGVFHSVEDLIDAIETYLRETNKNPKPFIAIAQRENVMEILP